MSNSFFCAIASLAALTALVKPARADLMAVASFDTGASGWSSLSVKANPNDDHPNFNNVVQDYPVTWSATGGNPGGTIGEVDQDSGWQYFAASSAFLGDQSAAAGGSLSFDLLRTDNETNFPLQDGPALAMTDGKTVLVFSQAVSAPTTAGWTSYTFDLTAPGVFVTSEAGKQATEKQLDKVLADLTGVYILADWYTGIGDSYNLDNVVLRSGDAAGSVPDPASWALLTSVLGLLLLCRRSRQALLTSVSARRIRNDGPEADDLI